MPRRPAHGNPGRYSPAELWADGAVHATGLTMALAGSAVFLAILAGRVSTGQMAAASLYVATLLLSIGASAAYNVWPAGRTKWLLRRLDHSAIYLLIAGTYTPFIAHSGAWRLMAAVWAIALTGVLIKLAAPGRFDRLAIALYLALGWSGIAAYYAVFAGLAAPVFWLLLAGGLTYSAGVIFHVWERLRFQNAIWHAFVLGAATTHFIAVWFGSFA